MYGGLLRCIYKVLEGSDVHMFRVLKTMSDNQKE